jgi:hypothetical protein
MARQAARARVTVSFFDGNDHSGPWVQVDEWWHGGSSRCVAIGDHVGGTLGEHSLGRLVVAVTEAVEHRWWALTSARQERMIP